MSTGQELFHSQYPFSAATITVRSPCFRPDPYILAAEPAPSCLTRTFPRKLTRQRLHTSVSLSFTRFQFRPSFRRFYFCRSCSHCGSCIFEPCGVLALNLNIH